MRLEALSLLSLVAGWETVTTLRTSVGIRPDEFWGPGRQKLGGLISGGEVECSGMSSSSSVVWGLRYDSFIKDDDMIYMQMATLYTTPIGQL